MEGEKSVYDEKLVLVIRRRQNERNKKWQTIKKRGRYKSATVKTERNFLCAIRKLKNKQTNKEPSALLQRVRQWTPLPILQPIAEPV